MTTIRERFTAALRDDIRSAISNAYYENRGKGQTMETAADAAADAVLAIIARRLDFATAWDDAVAALPEVWSLNVTAMRGRPFVAEAWNVHTFTKAGEFFADTPTDALVALTEALRERAR